LLCRFLGIKKIGGSGFKTKVAAAIVTCLWIYNVAFHVPMFMWANVYVNRYTGAINCYPGAMNRIYNIAARFINFYVPLTITWTSNIGIVYKLKRTINKAIIARYLFCHLKFGVFVLIIMKKNSYVFLHAPLKFKTQSFKTEIKILSFKIEAAFRLRTYYGHLALRLSLH